MKVKELIEILKNCNTEQEIILASDSEGNSFSKLVTWNILLFDDSSSYELDVFSKEDILEDKTLYDTEEIEYLTKLPEAIVLWPTI